MLVMRTHVVLNASMGLADTRFLDSLFGLAVWPGVRASGHCSTSKAIDLYHQTTRLWDHLGFRPVEGSGECASRVYVLPIPLPSSAWSHVILPATAHMVHFDTRVLPEWSARSIRLCSVRCSVHRDRFRPCRSRCSDTSWLPPYPNPN